MVPLLILDRGSTSSPGKPPGFGVIFCCFSFPRSPVPLMSRSKMNMLQQNVPKPLLDGSALSPPTSNSHTLQPSPPKPLLLDGSALSPPTSNNHTLQPSPPKPLLNGSALSPPGRNGHTLQPQNPAGTHGKPIATATSQ